MGDNENQTISDWSGAANDGVYNGGVTRGVQGALIDDYSNAVEFDGSSGNASIPDSPTLNRPTNQITMEAWVRPANDPALFDYTTTPRTVLGKGDIYPNGREYEIQLMYDLAGPQNIVEVGLLLNGTYRRFDFRGAGWQPGVWAHLVVTYDGTAVRLYMNGVQWSGGAVAASGTITALAAPFTIGGLEGGATIERFPGAVDEVAIYPKALTPAQILAHYNAGAVGRCVNITGAQAPTFLTGAADLYYKLRAVVTATDTTGSTSVATDKLGVLPTQVVNG